MPEVSVVIPAYNHGQFIEEAVRSVLEQTFSDLELIVIDDGSQDDTLERLAGLQDRRMRVISQENRGAHVAINRGLAAAQGRYLSILNSDDVYHPHRIERMLPLLAGDDRIGLIASHIEVIDGTGRTLGVKQGYANLEPWLLPRPERSFRAGSDLRAALLTENYLSTTSNFLMRRSWYERIGEFTPLRYTHDWDFALRMARHAAIDLFPEPLLKYRIHGANTIHENQAAMIFEICWCLAVNLPIHVNDNEWYALVSPPERTAQLLHSIYVFGQEKVLAVMLAYGLHAHPEKALSLLAKENLVRQELISYISEQMTEHPQPKASFLSRWARWVQVHLISRVRSSVQTI
jgi:glycosyltransferase involved in cell wall biosynthesis